MPGEESIFKTSWPAKDTVIIYQDNLSCMAIMEKRGPTSERSRHINIRYFWLCERIKLGEVKLVHRATALMYANVLTKPLQGK